MKNISFVFFTISIIFISLYLAIDTSNIEGYQVGTKGIISICQPGSTDTCYDVSYIDAISSNTIQVKAKIDPNYYIDSTGMLQMVPFGYVQGPDKKSYIPKSKSAMYEQGAIKAVDQEIQSQINALTDSNYDKNRFSSKQKQIDYLNSERSKTITDENASTPKYNSDNYNITYHDDPTNRVNNEDESTAGVGKMWIRDKNGDLISVPYSQNANTTLYYETGSYPFGPSSYVPNYEETVYLSKLTNKPTTSKIYNLASQKGGFCAATKSSMINREQKCLQQDVNTCASTECCVLLGGEKCVAGNANGPSMKSNYSDFLLVNRDYYYYKGKCYGNCS